MTQNYEDYNTCSGMHCNSWSDCNVNPACTSCRRVHEDPANPDSQCLKITTLNHKRCITKCLPKLPKLCTLHDKTCLTDADCVRAPHSASVKQVLSCSVHNFGSFGKHFVTHL